MVNFENAICILMPFRANNEYSDWERNFENRDKLQKKGKKIIEIELKVEITLWIHGIAITTVYSLP